MRVEQLFLDRGEPALLALKHLVRLVRMLLLEMDLVGGGLDSRVRTVWTPVGLFAAVSQHVSTEGVVVAGAIAALLT